MTGTLFLVVGPSGVGKDTLLDGAHTSLSVSRWFRFVRRAITRPADAGGEDHIALTEAEFDTTLAADGFFHHWAAHGLRYGVSADVADDLAQGRNLILNTSRRELAALAVQHPRSVVLHVTASPATVAARLRARGREDAAAIARRLAQDDRLIHEGLQVIDIRNDGPVAEGVQAMCDAITGAVDLRLSLRRSPIEMPGRRLCLLSRANPVAQRILDQSTTVELFAAGGDSAAASAAAVAADGFLGIDDCAVSGAVLDRLGLTEGAVVEIRRSPSPQSRDTLRRKIAGAELGPEEIARFVGDMVAGRYSEGEIAGFLVAAARNLTEAEVSDLARVRAGFAHRQHWDAPVVVDKHSMGGIPGNRITPIVIPIVAACGLTFPKTSSRAITSAAGTADAMEVIARVDLTAAEMQAVVRETGACIAWNGRLTHSPVDDVMNAINRPLGLTSALLDVSSIISKKLAAGSTHVIIDIPVGPQAKTTSQAEAEALARMFVQVGARVGLKVQALLTDGTRPIGHGIGAALEMRDVMAVLRGDPDAPADLRAKALHFAAAILCWAKELPEAEARKLAMDTLASGAALDRLQRIATAQGPAPVPAPVGAFSHDIPAPHIGTVAGFSVAGLSRLARAAGAPGDKGAGIDILALQGTALRGGTPLLRLHASSQYFLDAAREDLARTGLPVTLQP